MSSLLSGFRCAGWLGCCVSHGLFSAPSVAAIEFRVSSPFYILFAPTLSLNLHSYLQRQFGEAHLKG